MTLGYTVKKGIFVLNDEGKYDKETKVHNTKQDTVISGDYTRIRTLSEKAQDMLERKRRKQEAKLNKSAQVNKEIKDNVIDFMKVRGKYHKKKNLPGQLNKKNPIVDDGKDIIFELHKEVIVDYGSYNLKSLVDYTLTTLDNILNSSKIPNIIKGAINTSLKTLIGAFSINSIGRWITFLKSIQKILTVAVDSSDAVKSFTERLNELVKVPENSYKDDHIINEIYTNAFSDMVKGYTIDKNKNTTYNINDILTIL